MNKSRLILLALLMACSGQVANAGVIRLVKPAVKVGAKATVKVVKIGAKATKVVVY